MSPPVAQQVLSALRVLSGADGSHRGQEKLRRLRDNANYLRRRLLELGVNVLGDWDSPVMPIMLFQPGKIAALSRECLKRGLAMVVVGFPATPLLTARARVCVSAAHSREDLDYAVDVLDEVAGLCLLRYGDRKKVPLEGEEGVEGEEADGTMRRERTTSDDEAAAASSAAALIS
jgi:serine palmitoyltransferase